MALGVALALLLTLAFIGFSERDTIHAMLVGDDKPAVMLQQQSSSSGGISGQMAISTKSTSVKQGPIMDTVNMAKAKYDTVVQYKNKAMDRYRSLPHRHRVWLVGGALLVGLVVAALTAYLIGSRLFKSHQEAVQLEEGKTVGDKVNDYFEPAANKSYLTRFTDTIMSAWFVVKLVVVLVVGLVVVIAIVHHRKKISSTCSAPFKPYVPSAGGAAGEAGGALGGGALAGGGDSSSDSEDDGKKGAVLIGDDDDDLFGI